MPARLEAYLQVHRLLTPLSLLQKLFRGFHGMGLGLSVHNTHFVNTVCPVLLEVTDQEVYLMFRGLWRRRSVPFC